MGEEETRQVGRTKIRIESNNCVNKLWGMIENPASPCSDLGEDAELLQELPSESLGSLCLL